MGDTIVHESGGGIARMVLNNPERHNSLGSSELHQIRAFLDKVSRDDSVRVLVVTGAGEKTFCAGASLQELNSGKIKPDDYQDVTDELASLTIPTICAINGNVFGGGVELALSCDFRIGIEGSRLRVPAASIGLCYPVRGIERFVEKLGVNAAQRLLVASETLSADDMLRVGFLDHLVMPAQFQEKVDELAAHIAGLAPLAVSAMKAVIKQAARGPVNLDTVSALLNLCGNSEDLQEGFAAISEKRAPVFKGR